MTRVVFNCKIYVNQSGDFADKRPRRLIDALQRLATRLAHAVVRRNLY